MNYLPLNSNLCNLFIIIIEGSLKWPFSTINRRHTYLKDVVNFWSVIMEKINSQSTCTKIHIKISKGFVRKVKKMDYAKFLPLNKE